METKYKDEIILVQATSERGIYEEVRRVKIDQNFIKIFNAQIKVQKN